MGMNIDLTHREVKPFNYMLGSFKGGKIHNNIKTTIDDVLKYNININIEFVSDKTQFRLYKECEEKKSYSEFISNNNYRIFYDKELTIIDKQRNETYKPSLMILKYEIKDKFNKDFEDEYLNIINNTCNHYGEIIINGYNTINKYKFDNIKINKDKYGEYTIIIQLVDHYVDFIDGVWQEKSNK